MAMNPRLLVPRASYDPDAARYLAAVEAADGQALETPVKRAVDAFFAALKADGLFDAIKASCILCGARTITGALVPLAGAAPTAEGGWASEDYSRTAGMTGDGVALYLDSNRANNADPQNDNHNAVYVTQANSTGTTAFYIDSGEQTSGSNNLGRSGIVANLFVRNRTSTGTTLTDVGSSTALIGHSRSSSSSYVARALGSDTVVSAASQSPTSTNIKLYARPGFSPEGYSNATIAFYSIGTSVDLEALDTAVSNLITAIGNAL